MVQRIVPPLSRQLETYRHQAVAAPRMLDDGTLAPAHVAEVLANAGFPGRNRLFPPQFTLWTFLRQLLSPAGSCRDALSRVRPWMIAQGHTPCSPHTGSYGKARHRLPEGVMSALARHRGQGLGAQVPQSWPWKGRRVTSVDGSTVSMPDTAANQEAYPPQQGQQPGLGCPIARVLAVLDVASGALTTLGVGRYQGKATGEMAMLRQQQRHVQRGAVV